MCFFMAEISGSNPVGPQNGIRSGCLPHVAMMDAREYRDLHNLSMPLHRPLAFRRLEVQRSMRSRLVVVRHVLQEECPKVTFTQRNDVVDTLASQCAYQSLGDCVRFRCMHRRQDSLDAYGLRPRNEVADRKNGLDPG